MNARWWGAALLILTTVYAGVASAQPAPAPAPPWKLPPIPVPSIQVRTLEVRDIVLGAPATGSVSIGRIAFKNFARGAESVRAESVEFENVSGQFGARKLEIPGITISGFEVPGELFRVLTEGGTLSLDWATILEQSTIGEISIDTATEDYQSSPPFKITYSGFSLKKLAKGIADTASIRSAHGGSEAADADDRISVGMGEIQYRSVDVAELVRFATGGVSGGPKPLIERTTLNDLSITGKEFTVGIRKLEQVGLDGRAPPLAAPEPGIVMPGVPPAASPRRTAQYARDIARHLRIGHYSIEGMSVGALGAGVTIEVASLSLGGVSGRGVQHLQVKAIDVSTPLGKGKLERFVVEQITFGSLLDMIIEIAATGRMLELPLEKLAEGWPRSAALRLSRLELDTPLGAISAGEVRMDVDDPEPILPERTTIAVTAFKMDVGQALGNEARDQLGALGYKELSADLQIEMRWRAQERGVSLENTRLLIDNVGRVDLTLRLGHVDPSIASADEAAFGKALLGAHIQSLGIRLTNLGLAERLYAAATQGNGLTPEAARAALAADANLQAAAVLGPALAPGSAGAIEAFVRSPDRLIAHAAPREGQPPLTIGNAAELALPQLLERIIVRFEIPQK